MKFKSTNEIETIQLRDAQIKEMKLVGVGEVEAEASGEEKTDGTAEIVSEVKADVAEAAGQAPARALRYLSNRSARTWRTGI